MKKIVVTILAVLLVGMAGAQSIFDSLVEEYSDQEGFSAVQLTSDMFELYLKKKNIDESDPVYSVLKNLDNIMVLTQTFTDDEEVDDSELKSEILDHYNDSDYTLFKTEKRASSDLKIYVKKNDGGVKSMGLLSSNSYSINLIEMNGDIDLANIASLDRALNIRGLEQLRVFNDKSPYNFYFNYDHEMPNLERMNSERQKQMEEQIQERQERMQERIDEQRKRAEEYQKRSQEYYEKYNRFPIILNGGIDEDADYYVNGKKVDLEKLKEIDPSEVKSIQVIREDESGNKANIKIQVKEDKNEKK